MTQTVQEFNETRYKNTIGDDWIKDFQLMNTTTNTPIDITNYQSISIVLKENPNSIDYADPAFPILATFFDAINGKFRLHIPKAVTGLFTVKTYYSQIAVIDDSGNEVSKTHDTIDFTNTLRN